MTSSPWQDLLKKAHDELLDRLEFMVRESVMINRLAWLSIRELVKLHAPVNGHCRECELIYDQKYPCQTIEIIERKLNEK